MKLDEKVGSRSRKRTVPSSVSRKETIASSGVRTSADDLVSSMSSSMFLHGQFPIQQPPTYEEHLAFKRSKENYTAESSFPLSSYPPTTSTSTQMMMDPSTPFHHPQTQ